MMIKKNGGIWFIRVGRFGGSFYIAKPKPRGEWNIALRSGKYEIATTALIIAALFGLS